MTSATTAKPSTTRSWGELIPVPSLVRMVWVAGLWVLAYWGVIRHQLVGNWMYNANWSHGWLIPLFGLYFLYARRERLLQCRVRPSYFGTVVLLGSLFIYFLSAWRLKMAYPQALSMIGAIWGLTLLMAGWDVLRVAWFPILFLFFAIPLPNRLFVYLTMPLRAFASTVAATVMPIFSPGLHTEAQAVIIDYITQDGRTGQLNVEEACSGMRSLMAFVTLGVAMTYLHDRPLWQRVVMILSCVPIAVFCNIIRVTLTGLFYVNGMRSLAEGTPHALLGLAMFAIALGLFSLLGWLLNHLFVEEPDESNGQVAMSS